MRVLKDGSDLKQTGSFYLAARPYAEKNGAFIEGVLATFSQADALTISHRQQSIALLAKTMGLPEAVIASYLDHRPPTAISPVSAETAARQQQTADLFYENKLVPKKSLFKTVSGSLPPHKERNHESEYVLVLPPRDGRYLGTDEGARR